MMKLTSFRIKNFRSIVDTGWQEISKDNITCLIGQNESGKTSILEGLKIFYTGVINEDVLRSDLSLPEVSCRFSIPAGWLLTITDNPGTELKELLSGLDHLELTRKWIADLSSVISVSGEISEYLSSLENAWNIYLSDVENKLSNEIKDINQNESILKKLTEEEAHIKELTGESDKRGIGERLFGKKHSDNQDKKIFDFASHKKRLEEIKKSKESVVRALGEKQMIKKYGDKLAGLEETRSSLNSHLSELSQKLEERHQRMTLLMSLPDNENDHEWKTVLNDYRKTRSEIEHCTADYERQVALSGYVMDGISEANANEKVNDIITSYKSQYNSDVLGRKYFEYSPRFELFEDFGSLLPNRIDMEDILSGNENVEGFKAARNFLSLARLDYSFFQQPSSRILQQKIENLNQSLTRTFHDFWQQSVGGNNKIHIQFELEHYNASFGPKAGKPYLEFWIKDEGERLYPKQRSRGVRWFLSFYMELKASANLHNRQLVLLVDEPGVSLHARAQEDVLKVFEDIKDKVQVIYTTHSPHLVEINKLHRVLAIQRDDFDNHRSTTRILDPLKLSSASPDTLTPLQSLLGNPMAAEGFSSKRYNLIVNDTGSFYLLSSIFLLTGFSKNISVIPSTNIASIPLLCNVLMGWGMRFGVLLFANDEEQKAGENLKNTIFRTDNSAGDQILNMNDPFFNAEDLLSTLDFKNYVLKTREGITIPNSIYIADNEVPRNFVLSRFLSDIKEGKLKLADFDEESTENFRMITDMLKVLK